MADTQKKPVPDGLKKAKKLAKDEKMERTQNDEHNIKREALGPNAGRNQNN